MSSPRYFRDVKQYIHVCSSNPPLDYLDHWIPLTPLEQMARTDYDVIIVGTGAGGGAVLWRLCDKWRKGGKRIAVIERGDLLLPTHAMNLPTLNYERMIRFVENPKFKQPITCHHTDLAIPLDFSQFFAFGGRTLYWGTGSPRFHPLDFQTWPFTYQELLPYYQIAERVMGVSQKFTQRSTIQQNLLRRLRTIGYVEATDFPLAIDHNFRKNGLHLSAVFSSINLFAHALNVGAFDLAVNARVVQVFTDKGTVVGVQVLTPSRKAYVIKGKIVVLAASTLENPHILLCSGIQDESIGRYLVNHSWAETEGRLEFVHSEREIGNMAILVPRTHRQRYQVEIHLDQPYEYAPNIYGEIGNRDLRISMRGFGAVEPRYTNRVSLSPNQVDEYGIPKLAVHFTFSERDLHVIQQMISSMENQACGIGIHLIAPPCLKPPGRESHESGTCRMGNNPHFSVTNQYGELHQVSNLFVADSSVLPYIGGTNPALTIVAVAIRTADYILHRLKN
ncbi:GMC oxidoreductase [Alicyclobacillus dauci]|uniref:GMC family oxidoreductase n=1 Tax=Alicyclobacillus dauci TaxID=1475485 RepID=A0ABY6Z9A0_9BACL|nr:GMC family oxidoreductase [Alicyclobacillus dauci]WAH38741.1 GMC family oxidoreductase [Alicyclobacillus dauci]